MAFTALFHFFFAINKKMSTNSSTTKNSASTKAVHEVADYCKVKERNRDPLAEFYNVIEIKGPNEKLECKFCHEVGWHMSAFGKHHAQGRHGDEEQWKHALSLFPTRKRSHSISDKDDEKLESMDTADTVLKFGARFIVTARLPLDIIENQEFIDLLNAAVRYGADSGARSVTLPKRDSFVKNTIEGEYGLLREYTKRAIEMHKSVAQYTGLVMLLDSATASDNRSCTSYAVQSTQHTTVLNASVTGVERKTGVYMHKKLVKVLKGTITSGTSERSGKDARAALSELTKALTPYVWCAVADTVASEQKCLRLLRKQEGIINVGCQAHRFNRLCASIMGIKANILEQAKHVIDTFKDKQVIKELLRDQGSLLLIQPAETRFLSWVLVIKRLLKQEDDIKDIVVSQSFKRWLNEQIEKEKVSIQKAMNSVGDDVFWTELKRMDHMCLPITNAL
jgi:hypothetical protein